MDPLVRERSCQHNTRGGNNPYVRTGDSQSPSFVLYDFKLDQSSQPEVGEQIVRIYNADSDSVPDGQEEQTNRENERIPYETITGYHDDLRQALKIGTGPAQREQLLKVFDRFVSEAEEGLELIRKGDLAPTRVGGRAGGAKYIWKGVFIKRADDLPISVGYHMYGGLTGPCRHWAGKAAGNELKASNTLLRLFFSLNVDIMIPLQTLFDFSGERYIAMSVLPLQGAKLIYGSADGGLNVHASDEGFNKLIANIAEELHLAAHSVVRCKEKLHMAGDIEGHRTQDGQYCLLDLARTWPPEEVTRPPPSAVFFRLFRPEFLAYLRRKRFPALSPDALSSWSPSGPELSVHNNNIRRASEILRTERVVDCLQYLEHQLLNDVPKLDTLMSAIPVERARDIIKAALMPLMSRVRCPAQLLPALNVVFLAHRRQSSDDYGGFHNWTPLQLAENSDWSYTYGLYEEDFRLGSVLHKFGLPVRYLPLLLTAAANSPGIVRKHIRLEIVRRCAKTHMRWLLAHDKAKAYAFLTQVKQGIHDKETFTCLAAIGEAKYGCTGIPFEDCLTHKRSNVAEYVQKTCGVVVSTTEDPQGQEQSVEIYSLKPRSKPNTFIAVVRAQYHFDIAVDRLPADYELKVSDLRKALELCTQVTISDPSDPEANDLRERCRVLVALEAIHNISLERADRVAVDHSVILRKWFTFLTPSDLALGVDIIGGKKLCLALAGALQSDIAVLEIFVHWNSPQEECAALGEAARAGATGLLRALFQLGLSTSRISVPIGTSEDVGEGQDSPMSPRSQSKKTGNKSSKKSHSAAVGALVIRRPDSTPEDGGEGNIGQVIALQEFDPQSPRGKMCVVLWLTTGKTQVCPEDSIQFTDDHYLQILCQVKDPAVAFKKSQRGKLWNVFSAVERLVSDAVGEKEVQAAFTEAWRVLCREKDLPSLALLRPHIFLSQELLRMAIKTKYDEGIYALLRTRESSPHAAEDVIPTPENNAVLYAATLGYEDQVTLLLRVRPLFGFRKVQLLFAGVAAGATALATLLDAKIDVRTADDENMTALHCAARLGDLSCVQLLLARNAPASAVNIRDETTLQLARSPAVLDLLVAGGSEPPLQALSIIHRLNIVGVPWMKVSEPTGKATILTLTSPNFRISGLAELTGDQNHYLEPIRMAVFLAIQRLFKRCNKDKMTSAAETAAEIVAMSNVLTVEAAVAMQTAMADPHVFQQAMQCFGTRTSAFQYLINKAVKLAEEANYQLHTTDVCKLHQLEKGAALIGKSIAEAVNIIDLTAIEPDREEALCCLKGSTTPFADAVLVLCAPKDFRYPHELKALIKRADNINKLTTKSAIGIWLVGVSGKEMEKMTQNDTILHISDPRRALEELVPSGTRVYTTPQFNASDIMILLDDFESSNWTRPG